MVDYVAKKLVVVSIYVEKSTIHYNFFYNVVVLVVYLLVLLLVI